MEIGDGVVWKRQSYRLAGWVPHTQRDGSACELALWETHCKSCGAPFTCTTPSHDREPRLVGFTRRCAEHRLRRYRHP